MSKIEIAKVMVFDDMECYEDKVGFLTGINKIMKRSFKDCNTLKDFDISENLEVQFFFIKNHEYYTISESNPTESQVNWSENIESYFQKEEGYLILCDYQWKGQDADINKKIYEAVLNNSNVIFVAYTSVMFIEAQHWIDKLLEENHNCKIVDILLTIPSDDMGGTFRSLEEAMWDEW